MGVPKTKQECDKRGWFWIQPDEGEGYCEKPAIVDIKMTLTRGGNCDDDEHHTQIPKPHKLDKIVRDSLLDVSEITNEPDEADE